ncbi:RNase adapter RapZ [Peptoniphilus catoniae]|uniref:RNase adapter RapZ n=1 Tax=Peptoniphilus catoniae TaxID=1660341 RepID=UPI0010FD8FE6|nr:RNase adapter RapZ [Peptoniphilus catoniae]
MEILVITGMSGAGKSKALNQLEDLGYFAMDNLPPQLIPKFAEIASASNYMNKVCVVVDVRSGEFFQDFSKSLKELRKLNFKYRLLFLDAAEDVIINRYKELRRPHPLSKSIVSGYKKELELMEDIKKSADYIIDTSDLTDKQLREKLITMLGIESDGEIKVSICSFGFKKGILLDGDLIFDVRFLPNPYYIEELKHLNGENKKTKDYVINKEVTQKFLEKSVDILNFLIPNYAKEGKSILVVGIGCTGGFHRSVAIANELGKRLKEMGYNISVSHRDVNRN